MVIKVTMTWSVEFTARARKGANKLPPLIRERLMAVVQALKHTGPIQPGMPHFGKLKNQPRSVYHCHLNRGRPTYVAVWEVKDKKIKLIEVTYAGTHEKAPY